MVGLARGIRQVDVLPVAQVLAVEEQRHDADEEKNPLADAALRNLAEAGHEIAEESGQWRVLAVDRGRFRTGRLGWHSSASLPFLGRKSEIPNPNSEGRQAVLPSDLRFSSFGFPGGRHRLMG